MEYIRKQFYTLKERLQEPRKFMQVLAGPRQVGKSTLVNQVLSQVSIPHTIEVADGPERQRLDSSRMGSLPHHDDATENGGVPAGD